MKTLLFLILSLSALRATAQPMTEQTLDSRLTGVTVFLQGAQINRAATSTLKPGVSLLKIKSLSPYIDDQSIQVKGTGNFTILAVNHRLNYLDQLKIDQQTDSLQQAIEQLDRQLADREARLSVLKEQQSLLHENKQLGGGQGLSLDELQQALDFYDKALGKIKAEETEAGFAIKQLQTEKELLEKQLAAASKRQAMPTGEITVRVEAAAPVQAAFSISYLVANAGWYPAYDVRVQSVESPVALNYKARIYQNTGLDWDNVKLKLSNGNPSRSGLVPQLSTWYLNFARNTIYQNKNNYTAEAMVNPSVRSVSGKVVGEDGEPLPGVTVLVKGSTIGTVTDFDGNYSLTLPNSGRYLVFSYIGFQQQELPVSSSQMNVRLQPDIMALEEVVVTGYARKKPGLFQGKAAGVQVRQEAEEMTTTTIENQTTVEFEVEKPYTVKNNAEELTVPLKNYEIPAIYEYYAVPKLEKDAFLVARITDWDQYNFLEGEASLYFEDAFVGRSVLEARSLSDTLSISLGRDRSLVIGREKVDTYSKTRTIGGSKTETRRFKIMARNKKPQTVRLKIFDQVPVAAIDDISVELLEKSGARFNQQTGDLLWELQLSPQAQQELFVEYEVKYPKRERVMLE